MARLDVDELMRLRDDVDEVLEAKKPEIDEQIKRLIMIRDGIGKT